MGLEIIQLRAIRLLGALVVFFLVYLPFFATRACECTQSVCEAGKMHGIFFCNTCACFTPTDFAVELFIFGIAPIIILYLIFSFLIRE